jgi:hypothetical protein
MAMDGREIYEGDVESCIVETWDLMRDWSATSFEASPWIAVRKWENKFDEAARYPNHAPDILDVDTTDRKFASFTYGAGDDNERVEVWHFFHKRTPALPRGRQSILIGDTLCHDGPLKTRRLPVVRMAAGRLSGTPWPSTPNSRVLAAQEVLDSTHSSLVTNISSTAGGLIVAPQLAQLSTDNIAGGPKIMYMTAGVQGKVEVLQLSPASPDSFKYAGELVRHEEQLLGLNATARGVPEYANLSGAAMAMLSSTAISNNSRLQTAYVEAVAESGAILLEVYQAYMGEERTLALLGKDNRHLTRTIKFGPRVLKEVAAVYVTIGGPLQQTTAGRMELANIYIEQGHAKTPEQIAAVMETGRLDPLTNDLRTSLLLTQWENEQLREGKGARANIYDDHSLHARVHRELLSDIFVRTDPTIVEAVLAHIDEHHMLMTTGDPTKLALVGLTPPQMLGPPGAGGEAPPPGGPPPGPPGMGPPPPGGEMPAGMPSMPTNPATGEQYQPPGALPPGVPPMQ